MWRILLLSLLGLTSCTDLPGSGHRVVARIGERTLSVERLSEIMVLAQPLPLTPEVALQLASHWVHVTAFSLRMAAGDSLLDSATVMRLMWYRVQQEAIAAWRERLLEQGAVAEEVAARFEVLYGDRLLQARAVRIRAAAATAVQRLAADPWANARAEDTLATFTGGALTSGELLRYLQYLPPDTHREMREAAEEVITAFLRSVLRHELLWLQAESARVKLSEPVRRAIAEEYRGAVRALWQHTGLAPASLAQAGATDAERQRVAAQRVEQYLDAAAARKVPLEPVPPFLAVPLLRDASWGIAQDRLDEVVERARRLLAGTEASGVIPAPAAP